MTELGHELATEKSQTAELQKALQQSQENLSKLQSDFYGKESEVSSLRQDLKVHAVILHMCYQHYTIVEKVRLIHICTFELCRHQRIN